MVSVLPPVGFSGLHAAAVYFGCGLYRPGSALHTECVAVAGAGNMYMLRVSLIMMFAWSASVHSCVLRQYVILTPPAHVCVCACVLVCLADVSHA